MPIVNYTPAPHSLAARLITHLETYGGTMTPDQIAREFNVQRGSISNTLKAPVQRGFLAHHSGGRGKVVYHLPGSTVTLPGATEAQADAAATTATRKKAPRKTKAVRAARERAPVPTTPGPAAPMQPPAIAALWDDGDFVLYGLTINNDDTVTMAEAQARQLHKFLERVFGPNQ